jgi:hypothetical protein
MTEVMTAYNLGSEPDLEAHQISGGLSYFPAYNAVQQPELP